MPWSAAEHARALLQTTDPMPRTAELTLRRIAGEELPVTVPNPDELVYVAKVVSATPVAHRFSERDGYARCSTPMSYGTRNALLPYSHAASFATDCAEGCFAT